MKRSGFSRPQVERPPRQFNRVTRPCLAAASETACAPIPKSPPWRSEAHRRAVAALPCIRCGVTGFSQCAHANTGKGQGLKTDDRDSFPLCTVHPGPGGALVQGCHEQFDQGAMFTKAERRDVEKVWVAATLAALESA